MNNGINLINYKNKEVVKSSAAIHRKLRVASIVLLFTVSAFSIMIFMLIALSPLPELNKQYNFASITLSQSVNDIVKFGIVNERTDSIKKIIDNRPQHDIILADIQKKVPNGVTIDKLSVKNKKINLEVSSATLSEIDNFIAQMIKDDDMSFKLSKVVMTRLAIDPNLNNFVVNVDINTL